MAPSDHDHWKDLASELGAEVPSEESHTEEGAGGSGSTLGVPSVPPAAPVRRQRPDKPTSTSEGSAPTDWAALAGSLGLEVPTFPEPEPPRQPEPPAARAERPAAPPAESEVEAGFGSGLGFSGPESKKPERIDHSDADRRREIEERTGGPEQLEFGYSSMEFQVTAYDADDDLDPLVMSEPDESFVQLAHEIAEESELLGDDEADEFTGVELRQDRDSDDEEEEDEGRRRRRRRRRRGRRRREPSESSREAADEQAVDVDRDEEDEDLDLDYDRSLDRELDRGLGLDDDLDEDFAGGEDDESEGDEADEDEEEERRGRRRRRGRGRRRRGRTPERARSPAPADEDLEDEDDEQEPQDVDDEGDEDEDLDDDGRRDAHRKHRKIPTWEEAISFVVDSNLSNRSRSRPEGRRGRGRRR